MPFDKIGRSGPEVHQSYVANAKLSDHALIEATKNGDDDAFSEIVGRYKSPITNYLYRFLNDYEEAVDLAQETFVRVYFAIERYHTKFAFSTYIYRIATNLAISEIRKRKRRKLLSLTGLSMSDPDEMAEFQPRDERPLPEEELIEDERARMIAKAIYSLPLRYKAPIILRDIEGLSYEEVAAVMELGLGTTKSRISRARGLLREKLDGQI
ncbi:RNA polymerase sigma factor [Leptolyngbya sp. 7M]|uniref:RNA polymerase sigma factor n=1 Tax=Leptolyngbya sp. 7M TaxID=2812896 RepID=UPI001B8C4024|nr:sigma-70 family RNA polymerase sigma factor [Leptolyngbya sp. 7M]QYO62957.1 sigma-70 family RNA polymerase sigma factor [Leptolyngbya sp. 7M]